MYYLPSLYYRTFIDFETIDLSSLIRVCVTSATIKIDIGSSGDGPITVLHTLLCVVASEDVTVIVSVGWKQPGSLLKDEIELKLGMKCSVKMVRVGV